MYFTIKITIIIGTITSASLATISKKLFVTANMSETADNPNINPKINLRIAFIVIYQALYVALPL